MDDIFTKLRSINPSRAISVPKLAPLKVTRYPRPVSQSRFTPGLRSGNVSLAPTAIPIAPAGLLPLAWWKFEESSGDRIDAVNGEHLIPLLTFGGNLAQVAGKVNFGVQFNGLTGEDPTLFDANAPFSISGPSAQQTVVGWINLLTANASPEFFLSGNTSSNFLFVNFAHGFSNIVLNFSPQVSFPDLPLNTFTFFCLELNAGILSIQFNNSGTVYSTTHQTMSADPTAYVQLDGLHFIPDEWAVFNAILTPTQKATLYNSGAGVTWPVTL